MAGQLSRRRFLGQAAAVGGALALPAISYGRVLGTHDRVRLASVGTGGKGWSDLTATAASEHADVVALCDVDSSKDHLGRAAERYASAKTFTDWRRLLDEPAAFDAVIVSTPDHMHAPISLAAMAVGKHVQCQKPLTHTVHEARQMAAAAEKAGVVTQMGNQIQSHPFYRTAVRLIQDGAIGPVREVRSWQSGGMSWLMTEQRPDGEQPVPSALAWDGWLGVAPARPYQPTIYHPFNWRAWQDFATGQLGDFGCHILDPVFQALELTAPQTIRADAPPIGPEVWTKQSTIDYVFPATKFTSGETITVQWIDGAGRKPSRDGLGLPDGYELPGSGSVFVGEKGTLVLPHVGPPKLFPEEAFADFVMPRVEGRDHYTSWVDSIRGEDTTTSPFSYAGPLTETVHLGTVAIRCPGRTLTWDAKSFTITGDDRAEAMLTKPYRKGWEPTWV